MFDIKAMIKNSDFSDLINSTKEERESFGGNQVIYNQLSKYKCIHIVKQVISHVFHADKNILKQLKNDCPDENEKKEEYLFSHTREHNFNLP